MMGITEFFWVHCRLRLIAVAMMGIIAMVAMARHVGHFGRDTWGTSVDAARLAVHAHVRLAGRGGRLQDLEELAERVPRIRDAYAWEKGARERSAAAGIVQVISGQLVALGREWAGDRSVGVSESEAVV